MEIKITTKNLEPSGELKEYIDERIGSLKKFANIFSNNSQSVFVEIEKETRHHRKGDIYKAEAIMRLPGKKIVAQAHGEDIKKVITQVKNELEQEIRKYKLERIDLPRRKARKTKGKL